MESFLKIIFIIKERFQDKYQERKYEKNDVISYRMNKENPTKLFMVTKGLVLVETKFGQNNMPFYSFIGEKQYFWMGNFRHEIYSNCSRKKLF